MAGILALVAVLAGRMRRFWFGALVAAASMCIIAEEARTIAEAALSYSHIVFLFGCALVLYRWFGRRNYLAYALLVWMLALRGPMMELFGNGNSALNMWGWVIAAVMALTAVWAAAPAVMARKGAHQAANNAA